MSGAWEGGKGSKPRPISDRKKFEDNWDRIFGKKQQSQEGFWEHNCKHNGKFLVASGESCSWCGEEENES